MSTPATPGAAISDVQRVDITETSDTATLEAEENNPLEIATVIHDRNPQPKPKSLDEPFKVRDADPQPGSEPPMQYTSTKPVMVTRLERLGEDPALIDCPWCKECKETRTTKSDSSQTSLAAAFCCLCCGIITVCIPTLCGWCQDVDHHCTGCGNHVARKPYEGTVEVKRPEDRAREISKYAKPGQEVSKHAHPTQPVKSYAPHSAQWETNGGK